MTFLHILACIVLGICAGLGIFLIGLCIRKMLRDHRKAPDAVCVCRCDAEPFPHDHGRDCPPCPNEWCLSHRMELYALEKIDKHGPVKTAPPTNVPITSCECADCRERLERQAALDGFRQHKAARRSK